eukprot:30968-Pelagococcus_subviridis.AAC.6
MEEHSDISSRNVDAPIAMLSLAPMRVCTPSMTVISALAAGTNDPHCAMTTMSARANAVLGEARGVGHVRLPGRHHRVEDRVSSAVDAQRRRRVVWKKRRPGVPGVSARERGEGEERVEPRRRGDRRAQLEKVPGGVVAQEGRPRRLGLRDVALPRALERGRGGDDLGGMIPHDFFRLVRGHSRPIRGDAAQRVREFDQVLHERDGDVREPRDEREAAAAAALLFLPRVDEFLPQRRKEVLQGFLRVRDVRARRLEPRKSRRVRKQRRRRRRLAVRRVLDVHHGEQPVARVHDGRVRRGVEVLAKKRRRRERRALVVVVGGGGVDFAAPPRRRLRLRVADETREIPHRGQPRDELRGRRGAVEHSREVPLAVAAAVRRLQRRREVGQHAAVTAAVLRLRPQLVHSVQPSLDVSLVRQWVRDPPSNEPAPARRARVRAHEPQQRPSVRAVDGTEQLELTHHVRGKRPNCRSQSNATATARKVCDGRSIAATAAPDAAAPEPPDVEAVAPRSRSPSPSRPNSAIDAATAAAAPPSPYPLPRATASTLAPPPRGSSPYIVFTSFVVAVESGSTRRISAGATRSNRASSSARSDESTNSSWRTSPVDASTAATPILALPPPSSLDDEDETGSSAMQRRYDENRPSAAVTDSPLSFVPPDASTATPASSVLLAALTGVGLAARFQRRGFGLTDDPDLVPALHEPADVHVQPRHGHGRGEIVALLVRENVERLGGVPHEATDVGVELKGVS